MSPQSNNKISVIMPCYNGEKYIAEAIKSVLNQSHKNLELIIVNDGSTDNSENAIRSFKDERIRYIIQENKGQCKSSNVGFEEATGAYIKFFDADDVMNEVHLEAQLERIDGKENCIASCAWGRFYDDNYESARFLPETVWKDLISMEWIKGALRQKYDMMGGWLWLIPRKLLEKSGGWNERLSLNNDFEFSMRLLLNSEMVLFAEEAKMHYRSGSQESLSQTKNRLKFEQAVLSTELGCKYLLDKESGGETRSLCANRYQRWIYEAYPDFPDLIKTLEEKVKELGGSNVKYDGGKVFQTFSNILGWQLASRFKNRLRRLGYKKLPF